MITGRLIVGISGSRGPQYGIALLEALRDIPGVESHDLIRHTVGKVLDQFGIEHDLFRRWEGVEGTS